jgi:hypothetical protein
MNAVHMQLTFPSFIVQNVGIQFEVHSHVYKGMGHGVELLESSHFVHSSKT